MTPAVPILLIMSDRTLMGGLAAELAADGFSVQSGLTAEHARGLARRCPPRLALIGHLEGGAAIAALLQEIRSSTGRQACWDSALPVLAICSQAGGLEGLRALEAGADDFMALPVSYLELRARLRAILRRASAAPPRRVLRSGPLEIDLDARRAGLCGHELELSRMEFELLAHLALDPGRAFSREELLGAIWGYPSDAATRTLDSHASRLRRKLIAISGERWIASVRGIGYRLI